MINEKFGWLAGRYYEFINIERVEGEMDIGKLNKCMFSIDLNFKILPWLVNYT